jgi:dTDP-4-dehydrorhamnose 3,5-epimerase
VFWTTGVFYGSYNKKIFEEYGLDFDFIQDNHSLSQQTGTIIGLYYQLNPKAQTKLIRVTRSDVVVYIILRNMIVVFFGMTHR